MPALLLALVVTACSQAVEGAPRSAPPGAAPTFGVRVPAGDRQKLDIAEQIRSVDPCGFFDQTKLAAHGEIWTLGPEMEVGSCDIGLLQTNRKQVPSHLTITMNSYPPTAQEANEQIAGETVTIDRVRNSHGNCAYKVPLRFPVQATGTVAVPDIVEVPPLAYATVTSFGFTPDTLGCQLVRQTVADIVTAFRGNHLPRRGPGSGQLPLSQRSPCELMQHLPPAYTVVKLESETTPYDCRAFVKTPESKLHLDDLISAGFDLVAADRAMKPIYTWTPGQVGGKPVLIDRNTAVGEPICSVQFPVGPVIDTYRPGAPARESVRRGARWQTTVTVRGPCRVTDAVMPSAMNLFGANA
ncbi:hypothetical protein [Nocardia asiatica]|uniref:hypothetical protein n=1 Tax=Nocardia asiatica TaxID=209252 RepID=UPI0012FC1286|nr:hypothetical protein [Nocardia asiatica]